MKYFTPCFPFTEDTNTAMEHLPLTLIFLNLYLYNLTVPMKFLAKFGLLMTLWVE